MVIMKKILFIMAAIMLIVATGCKKEDKKKDLKAITVGEWHCVPEGMDADIYVAFAAEGGFDLYQQIGEGRHRHYTGTWTLEGNILSGIYADETAWGSSYKVEFSDDNTMILTAQNGSEEIMTYVRESVPAEVKEGCIDVKSSFGMLNSQPQYRWL